MTTASNLETAEQKRKATVAELAAKQTPKSAAAAAKAAVSKDDGDDKDNASEGQDSPLLDLSDDAVKKMIKTAKKRGYVTVDELNAVHWQACAVRGLPARACPVYRRCNEERKHRGYNPP